MEIRVDGGEVSSGPFGAGYDEFDDGFISGHDVDDGGWTGFVAVFSARGDGCGHLLPYE